MLERRRAKKLRKKEKELRRQSTKRNGLDEHEEPMLRNGSVRNSRGSKDSIINNGNGNFNGGANLNVPKVALEVVAQDDGVTTTEVSVMSVEHSDMSTCGQTRCGSFSTAKKRRPPKSTLMLFCITAVFLVSFIPFLVFVFIRQLNGTNFYPSLTKGQEVVVTILSKSYLVNNVANPIVYGMCNVQFKREVTKLLRIPKSRPPSLSSRNESNHVSIDDDLK